MTELWAIMVVIFACFIGSFAPILIKKATTKEFKAMLFDKNLIAGLVLYGISTIIFIPTLRAGELSVLYPFVATTYVWVCVWSVKFLNEKMTKLKWIGIGLILIGVSFIGFGS